MKQTQYTPTGLTALQTINHINRSFEESDSCTITREQWEDIVCIFELVSLLEQRDDDIQTHHKGGT